MRSHSLDSHTVSADGVAESGETPPPRVRPESGRGRHLSGSRIPTIAAYPSRPPYAHAAIEFLSELTTDPRRVLDIGCGTGDIARRLAPLVDRVDAVDFSAGMIEIGRDLPCGTASNIRWIIGKLEDVPLDPPYALVTAGESLHWMDWEIVLPRL